MKPRIGLNRDRYHRYSWNDTPAVPGVTRIVSALDKSDPLIYWAKKITAKAAVHNYEALGKMIKTLGEDEVIKHLMRLSDMEKDRAAASGSRLHAYAEMMAQGKELPPLEPEDLQRAEKYLEWMQKHKPRFLYIEYMVYSASQQYGGTGDALAYLRTGPEESEQLWNLDYKSGKGAYATTALQLAGLQDADFIGFPGDPNMHAIPKADRHGVVHMRNDACELIEYDITMAESNTFRAMRQGIRWKDEREEHIQTKGILI